MEKDKEKDKMNLLAKPHFPKLISALLIMMVLLSCNFLTRTSRNPSPAAPSDQETASETPTATEQLPSGGEEPTASETPTATEQPLASTEEPAAGPDPLDLLLSMRSIIIHLTAQRPDGSSSSTQIEIDSAGNMHVKYTLPAITQQTELYPEDVDPPKLPNSYEQFVVGGKAYQPIDQDPTWMITPFDEDFIPTLSRILHGADGVALWLDILPDGSLISVGKETVGGFDTDKYTVNGTVDGQAITGSLWYEPQTGALVKADLNVPAALYDVMDNAPKGQLKINLDTQKANVLLVTLPVAPAATAQPTAEP